ncbi:MauE/DoxX family redox-associated membrane protein [Streptomyces rubiginosohelvolus]|uniref:MauE/DoxX family redox-associated membrane protein n=1 Tax=Streptomyces rubiginosohelvolus TaxID=67362 RepID=UPI00382F1E8B
MSTMVTFCQILMTTVYLLSAVLKLREFSVFRAHLISTLPVVRPFADFLAVGIVATELGTAFALMIIRPAWIGFSLSMLVLVGFTSYLAAMLRTRRGTSCGCVGDGGGPISGVHVTRNILLGVISGAGVLLATDVGGTPDFAYYFSLGPAVIVGALLLYLDEIVSFFK